MTWNRNRGDGLLPRRGGEFRGAFGNQRKWRVYENAHTYRVSGRFSAWRDGSVGQCTNTGRRGSQRACAQERDAYLHASGLSKFRLALYAGLCLDLRSVWQMLVPSLLLAEV